MPLRTGEISIEVFDRVIAMASQEESREQSTNSEVQAKPLSVEGINDNDLEGHVPREILQRGTRIVIPYWIDPRPNDELWITWLQDGLESRLYTMFYPVPLTVNFFIFRLDASTFSQGWCGVCLLQGMEGAGGNDDPSPPRQLTINHTPLIILAAPTFPHATLWGGI